MKVLTYCQSTIVCYSKWIFVYFDDLIDFYISVAITIQIQSLDITAAELLNFFIANPVGILDGSELQNGFWVVGGMMTLNSLFTIRKEINFSDRPLVKRYLN